MKEEAHSKKEKTTVSKRKVSISFFVHRVGFPKKSANSKARIPSENAHGSEQTQ
jgi:hypothetical protein